MFAYFILGKEHWLGLTTLAHIMSNNVYQLKVLLEAADGDTATAEYETISIGPSSVTVHFFWVGRT